MTTLGMGPSEMEEIADMIVDVLQHTEAAGTSGDGKSLSQFILHPDVQERVTLKVFNLLKRFPLYPELILD